MKCSIKTIMIALLLLTSKANAQTNTHGSQFSGVQTEFASNVNFQSPHKKVLMNFPAIDIPKHGRIELFDATGKRIPLGKNVSIQAMNKLPIGFYFLKVYCMSGTWTIEIKEQD